MQVCAALLKSQFCARSYLLPLVLSLVLRSLFKANSGKKWESQARQCRCGSRGFLLAKPSSCSKWLFLEVNDDDKNRFSSYIVHILVDNKEDKSLPESSLEQN